jgi:DNA-binding NarL/FixJ family response regulator
MRNEGAIMSEKAQLLMIDDDPSVLESFKLWLDGEGYLLHTSQTKEDAQEILKKFPIDVCLIDLKMEEEDGLQIGKALHNIDSLLKIIIITGYPSYESAIDAMKMGVFDYASKSSENKDILNKIKSAVNARRQDVKLIKEEVGDKKGIILVCHHVMIEEGFETFCRHHPEFHLAHSYHSLEYIKPGDFSSTSALVLMCHTCNPQLFNEPEEAFPPLRVLFPRASLVLFNCDPKDDIKKKLVKLGVKGFLPKNISRENMNKAFNTILKGQIWVSRKVAHQLLNELLESSGTHQYSEPQNPYALSNREIEILQAIASGLSNAEISNKLYISEKTVKAHINHLFKKMAVTSRTKAVKKAVEEHIL